MRILLDSKGEINYEEITRYSTVQELLDAVDIFLNDNTLHCDKCEESCCKKSWSFGMDNISANRLCNWDNETISEFIHDKLVIKENISKEFDQYVLKKKLNCIYVTESNLCTIYEQRPIICRLYICSAKSNRYNVIRELIGATFLKALVIEEEMRNNNYTQSMMSLYSTNPAVLAKDYNILLDDILKYAQEEGWLDLDDLQELYQTL